MIGSPSGSFDPEQADLYAIAKQRGMRELNEDIEHFLLIEKPSRLSQWTIE